MVSNEWKPFKKQAEFLALPTTIKEALYGGGAGSAKTETLLTYALVHRWHENPRFKQVFMRRTFPELRNEVVPRSREIYRPFGATFNKSDMCWTFPSGAMIFLGHCENEEDVHKYDSMEINLFTPDEITSFTEFIYLYIGYERTRAKVGSGLPAIIRAGGMPGGIGHTWARKRFIETYPKGGVILIGKGGNKRIYVHATLSDNPYTDPSYSQSLEALPEAEKQARKYGNWDAYLGQVFEEFRDKKYPDEAENALHVIEPFDIPDWWPKIVAMDWGFSAMTWVGYGAISPSKRLYVYREQCWKKTKIEEWAPFVRDFIDREDPRVIKVCKSAGQDRGQEHTIQQQIESALGRPVELSNNAPGSRIAGKMLIHEYLRCKSRHIPTKEQPIYNDEHARWLLRNKGLGAYKDYLTIFDPPQEERNLPKVQIFNNCPELVSAIKGCIHDKKNPEDVQEFDGDDPYDGFRYLVDAADRFFDESTSEFEKIQRREKIIHQLEATQDMTAFYRNARKLDVEQLVKPVRRIHHAIH